MVHWHLIYIIFQEWREAKPGMFKFVVFTKLKSRQIFTDRSSVTFNSPWHLPVFPPTSACPNMLLECQKRTECSALKISNNLTQTKILPPAASSCLSALLCLASERNFFREWNIYAVLRVRARLDEWGGRREKGVNGPEHFDIDTSWHCVTDSFCDALLDINDTIIAHHPIALKPYWEHHDPSN